MEMSKVTRYDTTKRGSFKISLEFYDWELSITIGAIKEAIRKAEYQLETNPQDQKIKGHLSYLRKLRIKYGDALSQVLKAEFRNLKLKDGQKELGKE